MKVTQTHKLFSVHTEKDTSGGGCYCPTGRRWLHGELLQKGGLHIHIHLCSFCVCVCVCVCVCERISVIDSWGDLCLRWKRFVVSLTRYPTKSMKWRRSTVWSCLLPAQTTVSVCVFVWESTKLCLWWHLNQQLMLEHLNIYIYINIYTSKKHFRKPIWFFKI